MVLDLPSALPAAVVYSGCGDPTISNREDGQVGVRVKRVRYRHGPAIVTGRTALSTNTVAAVVIVRAVFLVVPFFPLIYISESLCLILLSAMALPTEVYRVLSRSPLRNCRPNGPVSLRLQSV